MSRRGEGSPALLERRWFAAHSACVAQREQCEHIRQSLEQAERAWQLAHAKLRTLESLRDALGQELAEADATCECVLHGRVRKVMSAA